MALAPLFVFDLLSSLNLGEQAFVSLALIFIAFEITRVLRVGRKAGSFIGSMAWYGIITTVALAGAILLGWIDPNPSAFIGDVMSAGTNAASWLADNVVPNLPV